MIRGYIHNDVIFLDFSSFFPLTLLSYLLKQITCNINLNLLYIKYSQILWVAASMCIFGMNYTKQKNIEQRNIDIFWKQKLTDSC